MTIEKFEMWARCDSRNVGFTEKDEKELIAIPVEDFVENYLRVQKCEQHREKLLNQLKSDGHHEITVLKSKWAKIASGNPILAY